MKSLTNRQLQVLNFIKIFIKKHKYPPTIREIAADFNISVKGAYDHIEALKKKNQIKCNLNHSRTIEILEEFDNEVQFIEVPLLGNVAAGEPMFAEENREGTIKIPANVIKKGRHFALHVTGDSMHGAGILERDIAIFLHQPHAENGDIIIALINDEDVTLKRFFKEQNRIKLKSENPAYPPIYTQNIRILGKLQYIIRSYA